jgi:hypothetical protein
MVKARVFVVDVDSNSGEQTPRDSENNGEVVDFVAIPRVGENIIWNSGLDLDLLEVIQIDHHPLQPNTVGVPGRSAEPCISVIARWTWIA